MCILEFLLRDPKYFYCSQVLRLVQLPGGSLLVKVTQSLGAINVLLTKKKKSCCRRVHQHPQELIARDNKNKHYGTGKGRVVFREVECGLIGA